MLASGTGGAPLRGPGTLFRLVFNVPGEDGDITDLRFDAAHTDLYGNGDLTNPVALALVNGGFTVESGHGWGDMNGDDKVNSADVALALRAAAGQLMPSPEQMFGGDVNADTQVSAADVPILMRLALGLPILPPDSATNRVATSQPISLSLPSAGGSPGQTVRVPLRFTNVTDMAGADFVVTYDPDLLTATNVELTSLASSFQVQYGVASSGAIRIPVAPKSVSAFGLTQTSGTLAYIDFTVNSGGNPCSVTADLVVGRLNDSYGRDFASSALQRVVVTNSGQFTIGLHRVYLPLVRK